MNDTTQKRTLTEKDNFMLAYGSELIRYAASDAFFASLFKEKIEAVSWIDSGVRVEQSKMERTWTYLIPTEHSHAVRRLEWLMGRILAKDESALLLVPELKTWSETIPTNTPQNLVIGIVGVAIPGITLGNLKIKKRNVLNIVLPTENRNDLKRTINRAVRASHGLVSREIRNMQGNAFQLEPDLADWFFGEQITHTVWAKHESFKNIQETLIQERVPFNVLCENDSEVCIAIHPLLSSETVRELCGGSE